MIKTALLNRKCKKLSKQQQSESYTYRNSTSIGILYNSEEFNQELVDELIDSFSGDGKETAIMAYTQKESEDRFSFCKKDLSLSGEIRKEPVGFFVDRVFDFLVSLDTTGDVHYKYVLAVSKAKCKVGIDAEPLKDLLVLSIKKGSEPSQSIRDVIKYLKMI